MAEPEISFITVTWNCADELAMLLDSLRTHIARPYEVVIFDNGSTDHVAEIAAADETCRLLTSAENVGFGGGNNRGIAEARAPVSVLINPDTYLPDRSIENVCSLAEDSDALYGPQVLNTDFTIQPSASPVPGGISMAASTFIPTPLIPGMLRERVEPWRSYRTREVGWLTGVCIVARTELLQRLGPFDPAIHMYSEDLELGMRAANLGIPSIFAPRAGVIVHIGDASSSKRYADAGKYLSVLNRVYAVRRHRGPSRAYLDLALLAGGLVNRLAAKRLLGRTIDDETAWLLAIRKVVQVLFDAKTHGTEDGTST